MDVYWFNDLMQVRPIQIDLHSCITVCIKKLSNRISIIRTYVKYDWIIFSIYTVM